MDSTSKKRNKRKHPRAKAVHTRTAKPKLSDRSKTSHADMGDNTWSQE